MGDLCNLHTWNNFYKNYASNEEAKYDLWTTLIEQKI